MSINSNVSDFKASLVYFCGKDPTCTNNPEKDLINYNIEIELEFVTPIKKMDHQSILKPISDGYDLLYSFSLIFKDLSLIMINKNILPIWIKFNFNLFYYFN